LRHHGGSGALAFLRLASRVFVRREPTAVRCNPVDPARVPFQWRE
jgi:hypothetical protein